MKKLIVILVLLSFLGCRTKTKLVEKEQTSTKIEKIAEVEKNINERVKKDSIVKKEDVKKDTNTSSNVHIEFDPKKHDSLEVIHILGNDSLYFKANGNGVVIFDYKKHVNEVITTTKEIFGSETLYNIDSVVTEKVIESAETKTSKSSKAVKEKGTTFGIYFIIGGAVLFIILLVFLYYKFGGSLKDRFKNGKF